MTVMSLEEKARSMCIARPTRSTNNAKVRRVDIRFSCAGREASGGKLVEETVGEVVSTHVHKTP